MLNPGKMDQKIRIEKPATATQNDYGEKEDDFTLFAEPWAEVIEQTGREFLKGGQEGTEKKVIFKIRWLDISETFRIIWEGRVYDIQSTKLIGRREGLEIFAFING